MVDNNNSMRTPGYHNTPSSVDSLQAVEQNWSSQEIQSTQRNRTVALFLSGLLSVPALAEAAFAKVVWRASAEKGSAELIKIDEKKEKAFSFADIRVIKK